MCEAAELQKYCRSEHFRPFAFLSRHIDRTLGAPINTFVIAAKTCIAVLREEDTKEVRDIKRSKDEEKEEDVVTFSSTILLQI